jgi:hypothetical protein
MSGGVPPEEDHEEHESSPVRDQVTPPTGRVGTSLSAAVSPPSKNLDANHDDDAPLRYKHLADILGPGSPPGQAAREATSCCWRRAHQFQSSRAE